MLPGDSAIGYLQCFNIDVLNNVVGDRSLSGCKSAYASLETVFRAYGFLLTKPSFLRL